MLTAVSMLRHSSQRPRGSPSKNSMRTSIAYLPSFLQRRCTFQTRTPAKRSFAKERSWCLRAPSPSTKRRRAGSSMSRKQRSRYLSSISFPRTSTGDEDFMIIHVLTFHLHDSQLYKYIGQKTISPGPQTTKLPTAVICCLRFRSSRRAHEPMSRRADGVELPARPFLR